MKTLFVLFTLFMNVSFSACTKETTEDTIKETYPFQFKGLLKKQEITTYQYGTHTISNEGKTYALKSSTINLDTHVNKTVTVKGNKINGYPVDGGPKLIDVKEVKYKEQLYLCTADNRSNIIRSSSICTVLNFITFMP